MAATGYADGGANDDGTVDMEAFELREIARFAGLPQNLEDLHEAAYFDRFGELHLPVEVAEKLAHAYASAEPEIMLMYIEDFESEYKAKGYEPGKRYSHDILREETPGFALARFWAGHEAEVAQLRREIERMRELVILAAEVLKKAGQGERGLASEARRGWAIVSGERAILTQEPSQSAAALRRIAINSSVQSKILSWRIHDKLRHVALRAASQ